jgi:hypothetical protein
LERCISLSTAGNRAQSSRANWPLALLRRTCHESRTTGYSAFRGSSRSLKLKVLHPPRQFLIRSKARLIVWRFLLGRLLLRRFLLRWRSRFRFSVWSRMFRLFFVGRRSGPLGLRLRGGLRGSGFRWLRMRG